MATTLRVKRRASGGAAGAPASLKTAELAWNMADGILYGGFGDDGSGNATSIKAFARDNFVANIPAGGTALQVLRKNAANDGYEWGTVSGGGGPTYTEGTGIDISVGDVISVDFAVVAPLASPALSGTPTAPTAAGGTNSTQLATTAFVQAAIAALIASAPGALDTLNELAAAMGDDPDFAATVTTALATKLTKASNLSDLTDAAAARGNLGLGSMATQAASAVAITGGTVDGVNLDGGTF